MWSSVIGGWKCKTCSTVAMTLPQTSCATRYSHKGKDMKLKFTDGVTVDTSGELRARKLDDGWYVIGRGCLIPVDDRAKAEKVIREMTPVKTVLKRPVELVVGDVIRAHGARWLVVEAPHQTDHEGGQTYATKTKFLSETGPGEYAGYQSMIVNGYTVQGNDLATWAVEAK
jgi:hypothetical protein